MIEVKAKGMVSRHQLRRVSDVEESVKLLGVWTLVEISDAVQKDMRRVEILLEVK